MAEKYQYLRKQKTIRSTRTLG